MPLSVELLAKAMPRIMATSAIFIILSLCGNNESRDRKHDFEENKDAYSRYPLDQIHFLPHKPRAAVQCRALPCWGKRPRLVFAWQLAPQGQA
jgi:hypothetical protein